MIKPFNYPNESRPDFLNVRIPAWIPSVDGIASSNGLIPERMKVLLHQFFLCYLKNQKFRKSKSAEHYMPDYFPVSSVLLRQTCTDNYIKYINVLIESGYIEKKQSTECSASYLPGGHAQLYRWMFPDEIHGGCSFRKDKISGWKQIKAVLRTRDEYAKQVSVIAIKHSVHNPVFTILQSYLNDLEFSTSFDAQLDSESDDLSILECEAWSNRDFNWFTIDSFGNRLHHPIASMPKEYRKHLRFKGHPDKEFVSLDIRNSQPYFSSVICNENLIKEYLPEFAPLLELMAVYEVEQDYIEYRKLCVDGQFYEYLIRGMKLNPDDEEDRKSVKKIFFAAVLFSKTKVFGENSKFRESFRKRFPNVHAMFQLIKKMDEIFLPELKELIRPKRNGYKYIGSSNAYKLVSCMMQRAESAMIYKSISPALIAAGIKFITIHDSFLLLPEDVETVRTIINDSFTKLNLPVPKLS